MKKVLDIQKELLTPLKKGENLEAKIIVKKRNKIFFDLGIYGLGVAYKNELQDLLDEIKLLKEGDKLKVRVIDPDNEEGLVEVSLKKSDNISDWEYIKEKMYKNEEVRVKILGANRGGLLTKIRDVDTFIPTSQLKREHYPDFAGDSNKILAHLKSFINKEMNVRIIGIERTTKKLVASERGEELEKIKEQLKKYKVGDIVQGEICGIVDYGVFVRFDSLLEGLVHISELDWQLIEDPKELVKIGEEVKAKIIAINGDQISLSMKALKEDPWLKYEIKEGDILEGEVLRIKPYGVVVGITQKIHGLLPVSKFKSEKEMFEKYKVGGVYKVKVLSFEPKEHRLVLIEEEKKTFKKPKIKTNKGYERLF